MKMVLKYSEDVGLGFSTLEYSNYCSSLGNFRITENFSSLLHTTSHETLWSFSEIFMYTFCIVVLVSLNTKKKTYRLTKVPIIE